MREASLADGATRIERVLDVEFSTALTGWALATSHPAGQRLSPGAPPRPDSQHRQYEKNRPIYCLGLSDDAAELGNRLLSSLWQPLIHEKIIGRRRRNRDLHVIYRGFLYFRLMLLLFHQQARQHRNPANA